MPKLGDIVSAPSGGGGEKKTFDFPLEVLYGYIDSERKHIRQAIVDAGREEMPNPLEQFTELLNAATNLANTSKSNEAKSSDYTMLLLQLLGKVLTTPELRDKIFSVIDALRAKPAPQPPKQA